MYEFFDLTEHADVRIPMYGTTQLLTVAGLLILLLITPKGLKNSVISSRGY